MAKLFEPIQLIHATTRKIDLMKHQTLTEISKEIEEEK